MLSIANDAGTFRCALSQDLPCGALPAGDRAVHRSTVAFEAGRFAGEVQRVFDGHGQYAPGVLISHRNVAVRAARERVASPIMRVPRSEPAADLLETHA